MGGGVETHVESARLDLDRVNAGVSVRMLGPLTIVQNGVTLERPASSKVRAL